MNDHVTVSVTVDADIATAFAVFTEETDLWWRKGPRFRVAGRNPGVLRIEPGPQGRLYEVFETPAGRQEFAMGRTTVWEPPRRLGFEWRATNFAPDEATQVEVAFEEVSSGTRVTVHHTGWAAIRPEHPVRHGEKAEGFIRMMGLWWADQLTSLRERVR